MLALPQTYSKKYMVVDIELVLVFFLCTDKGTQKKLATDPMYKLEHGSDDQYRGKSSVPSIAQIEDMRDAWQDDYILNRLARNKFRVRMRFFFILAEHKGYETIYIFFLNGNGSWIYSMLFNYC